jgi:hypothetical protein
MRLYRDLEDAGVGEAYRLAILNIAISAQLWLPIVLIEVSWRNLVDRILVEHHPSGTWWFLDQAPAPDSETFDASTVARGPAWLAGAAGDPISASARAFQKHVRATRMRRDDMLAHLTFGFWTLGAPAAALDLDPAIDIYTHAENHLQTGLGPVKLRARLNEMLALRNRIAHHEPIVLRVNTTVTKAGATQPPLAILRNAANGLDTFEQRAVRVADLAAALAPAAKTDIAAVPIAIRTMLDPIRDAIATSRIALEERRARRREA